MKSLCIYYVIDAYTGPTAGTEKQLLMLINGMVGHGHKVQLLVLRHTDYTRTVTNFPCPIESLDIRRIASLRTLCRMIQFRVRLRRERPDVVHAFFNDSAILIPLFCKLRHIRVFTSRRDMGFWHTTGRLLILRLANTFAYGIICNSHAVARMTREKEGVPWRKLSVVYNGIEDEDSIDARKMLIHAEHPDFLPEEGSINICLVANLRPIKRVEDLVHAAARVVNRVPRCRFWIVGASREDDYSRSLKQLVTRLDLEENVRFLGESWHPIQIMRRCDIGVLTSESEGLSNTLLEYLREGLAIVCSAVGGNTELIEHDKSGFLYPSGDVNALSTLLVSLCGDTALRARLAMEARIQAGRFSMGSSLESYLRIYAV